MEAMALDFVVTAPALFLVILFIAISFNSDPNEVESFDSRTLSKDDVLLIAHELGPSWEMLGRVLNVPDDVIDQIEANKSKDSEKCYSKCDCLITVAYHMIL